MIGNKDEKGRTWVFGYEKWKEGQGRYDEASHAIVESGNRRLFYSVQDFDMY